MTRDHPEYKVGVALGSRDSVGLLRKRSVRLGALLALLALETYFVLFYEVKLRVVNIVERGHELVRDDPTNPSMNDTFYMTKAASIHLHVIGPNAACPLHVHRNNEEATLVVEGLAHVTTRFGRDGQSASLDEVYPAGTLIALPTLCAHRWHNVTPGAYHNNLVFSRPAFTFNEFVKPDDPTLLRASPPSIVDLPERLSEFLKTDKAAELGPLPALGGTLFTLFVRDAYVVAARGKEPVSFYVVQGEGEIDASTRGALGPDDLAMMTHGAGARLTAHPGKALVGLLFYPER